jgi:hypothetical protein
MKIIPSPKFKVDTNLNLRYLNLKSQFEGVSQSQIWSKYRNIYGSRVEAPITDHLRDFFAPNLEKYKTVHIHNDCNLSRNPIPWTEIIMKFWSQKLARTYYQCREFTITTHFNRSFLLTLALMCHGIIDSKSYQNWIPTWSTLRYLVDCPWDPHCE